ncbi:hypothetical protein Daudx_1535 [Candidatus Desulforudis audaxviator]|nr:hypothetical protein Daudx_1535 [Candidatus Desulforudis audaxviator]
MHQVRPGELHPVVGTFLQALAPKRVTAVIEKKRPQGGGVVTLPPEALKTRTTSLPR